MKSLMKQNISPKLVIPVLFTVVLFVAAVSFALLWYSRYKTLETTNEAIRNELQIALAAQSLRESCNNKPLEIPSKSSSVNGWEILEDSPIIAHALGGYQGDTYLNCLEGFLNAYQKGTRVFEADFCLTSDGYVVLRHDWDLALQDGIDNIHIPTRDTFLSTRILNRYTPLSFKDLAKLMVDYPDICIITDTKHSKPEIANVMFHSMLEDVNVSSRDVGIFNRIIIQVYSREMFESLKNGFDFPFYIYTLYQEEFDSTDEAFSKISEYCANNGIKGITLPKEWWKDSFSDIASAYSLHCFTHPVNDRDEALLFLGKGIHAVYSSFLTPADLSYRIPYH